MPRHAAARVRLPVLRGRSVTGVDWGWVAAVTVIVAPFAYCALTTIRHTWHALIRRNKP
jgi:hypothetical protein